MNLLCISDFHSYDHITNTFERYLIENPYYDLVVFCGDICNYTLSNSNEIGINNIEKLKEICSNCSTEFIYIRGNHDTFEIINDLNFLPNVHKDLYSSMFLPMELLNIRHLGSSRECTEEDIKVYLNLLDIKKGYSILVSHIPPYFCLDKTIYKFGTKRYGSKALRDMIFEKEPRIVLCGHIHSSFGARMLKNTLVVNCASEPDNGIGRAIAINTYNLEYQLIEFTNTDSLNELL